YVVSNKTNDQFSAKGLASYLRKKGVEADEGHGDPEGAVITNAHKLLELLDAAVGAGPLWKHEFVRELVGRAWLEDLFPAMKEAYEPQPLDYGRNSRYGDKWRISCYLVVMENWKPKIMPHDPMVRCMGPVMDACVEKFREWHCRRRALASAEVSVMNAFVTRYRPIQEEDQLKRHIDGANVDGSVIQKSKNRHEHQFSEVRAGLLGRRLTSLASPQPLVLRLWRHLWRAPRAGVWGPKTVC
ncbi:unnamed protein product, partial [Prorocentrum cordatum]